MALSGLAFLIFSTNRPEWAGLAVLCVLASLILVLRAWWAGRPRAGHWIILDGSNVMHWKTGEPDLDSLRDVIADLKARGLKPTVVFDANAGYKLFDRYMNYRAFAQRLGLPVDHVLIAPEGTPADPLILQAARDYGAQIVTNDRYRDWSEDFSDLLPDSLVAGGFRGGQFWLTDMN